jgi:hypothetical protein
MYPYLRLAKLIYTKAAIPEILAGTLALLSVAVTTSFRKGPRRHGMGARNRIFHFYVEHGLVSWLFGSWGHHAPIPCTLS